MKIDLTMQPPTQLEIDDEISKWTVAAKKETMKIYLHTALFFLLTLVIPLAGMVYDAKEVCLDQLGVLALSAIGYFLMRTIFSTEPEKKVFVWQIGLIAAMGVWHSVFIFTQQDSHSFIIVAICHMALYVQLPFFGYAVGRNSDADEFVEGLQFMEQGDCSRIIELKENHELISEYIVKVREMGRKLLISEAREMTKHAKEERNKASIAFNDKASRSLYLGRIT